MCAYTSYYQRSLSFFWSRTNADWKISDPKLQKKHWVVFCRSDAQHDTWMNTNEWERKNRSTGISVSHACPQSGVVNAASVGATPSPVLSHTTHTHGQGDPPFPNTCRPHRQLSIPPKILDLSQGRTFVYAAHWFCKCSRMCTFREK